MRIIIALIIVSLLFMGITIAILNSAPYIALAITIGIIYYIYSTFIDDNND